MSEQEMKRLFEIANKLRFCDEDDDFSTEFCAVNTEEACAECLTRQALSLIVSHEAPLIDALREARAIIRESKFLEARAWNATFERATEFADNHSMIAKIDLALAKIAGGGE